MPKFGEGWNAAQRRKNAVVFVRSNAVLGQQLRGNRDRLGNDCRGGSSHHDCLHCRMGSLAPRERSIGMVSESRASSTSRSGTRDSHCIVPAALHVREPAEPSRLARAACRVAHFPHGSILHKPCAILALANPPPPGWRNWQTQRTQNPPIARSWGFDPPSRHQQNKEI